MAFSYSDENFTVIGNLCFVHILLDGTKTVFDIPPAISDRMLTTAVSMYPYIDNGKKDFSLASIDSGQIFCYKAVNSYLNFFFPIDSNK